MECLSCILLLIAGWAEWGCSCQAPLEPVLDLPGWRLLRGEDEDGACLQVPLVRHVVAAIFGKHCGGDPAFCLLLHAAADTVFKQQSGYVQIKMRSIPSTCLSRQTSEVTGGSNSGPGVCSTGMSLGKLRLLSWLFWG